MTTDTFASTREQVLEALRGADRVLLVTHENPDGDALGSLVAMQEILTVLGKDAVMFIPPDDFPLPHEYRFLALEGLVTELPADMGERLVVFLDCGNIDRNPTVRDGTPVRIINVDHHHDNTRFGAIDHVVDSASCTAEIVWDLMRGLGVEPTRSIADALYVGLVTDTGKFMYENTGTRAHIMAAELIEAGVDVHGMYHRLFEDMPLAKLQLLTRALQHVERYEDVGLTLSHLRPDDFTETGAAESHSEGIIDHLRAVAGTKVAALVRETPERAKLGQAKVSLRAADASVDVSAIARAAGGGGHRMAAGFTTDLSGDALRAFLREAVAAQL